MSGLHERALAATLSLAIAACQSGETKRVSSSSHWFGCDSWSDCAEVAGAVACREGRCVDARGAPIPKPAVALTHGREEAGAEPDAATDAAEEGGGETQADAAQDSAADAGGETQVDAAADSAADAASTISCRESEYAPPVLDKSCGVPEDCFAGFHVADCCGTLRALAFNRDAQGAFEQYESDCSTNLCPCPAQGTLAEDGSPLAPGTDPSVECAAGTCLARGPDASDCSGTMECIDAEDGGACVPALGPVRNGRCRGGQGLCFACRCAAPDTPIATPQGQRPIAALSVGDLVFSIDGPAIAVVPIVRISRVAAFRHKVMRVRLQNGSTLEISAGHPTADGRTFAALHAGAELGGVSILAAELVDYEHPFTYDILPASSSGAYFAGGVPVGSTLFREAPP